MEVMDVDSSGTVVSHPILHDLPGLVGGVVEDLDLQSVTWVVQCADRVDQAGSHVELVVEGKLNGDHRPAFGLGGKRDRPVPGPVVECHHGQSVHAVKGQTAQKEVVECQYQAGKKRVHSSLTFCGYPAGGQPGVHLLCCLYLTWGCSGRSS